MSSTLTKTGVIFGIVMFYIALSFFLGLMDLSSAISGFAISHDFGSGSVECNYYNSTDNVCSPTSYYECNDAGGLFGLNINTRLGECVIDNTLPDNSDIWSFNRVKINLDQLGWINILLMFPLIALIGFMIVTSSGVYNIE